MGKKYILIFSGLILVFIFVLILMDDPRLKQNHLLKHSCSTFLLNNRNSLLVGHNLDDYIKVPGLVVINKRGIQKKTLPGLTSNR